MPVVKNPRSLINGRFVDHEGTMVELITEASSRLGLREAMGLLCLLLAFVRTSHIESHFSGFMLFIKLQFYGQQKRAFTVK